MVTGVQTCALPISFVKPNPGGQAGPRRSFEPAREAMSEVGAPDTGLNPLVALAHRLLLVVTQLRSTRHLADPAALRNALAQSVRDFAAQAARAGIAHERAMAARYVLCTMIDEAAADTPWGGSGVWAQNSLLTMFHTNLVKEHPVKQHFSPLCLASQALGLAALIAFSCSAFANNALAEKHGCLGCHAVATKLVGPAYRDVAAKYAGDATANKALAQSIRNGGAGKWGEMPMPPQKQVSEADAKKLARWILDGAK